MYTLYLFVLRTILKPFSLLLNAVNVIDEEWDFLIILDACRFDVFREISSLEGKLEKRISKGSSTAEWLKRNFPRYYEDIVYISANPYISTIEFQGFCGSEHFSKVESVWDYGWDEATGTVHPQEVVKAALSNISNFGRKRIIIHFMQPHAPYIGETKITRKEIKIDDDTPKEETIQKIWQGVRKGHISKTKLKQAYIDNLKLVLNEVQSLIEKLIGKIIITSDHGECFGEWFVLGHPGGTYIKELIEVPWLIIQKETRRQRDEKNQIKMKIKKLKEEGKL
jgi:hypothetical protein